MNSTHKCPRCGTEYFKALAECDWCPEVEPTSIAEEAQETEELFMASGLAFFGIR